MALGATDVVDYTTTAFPHVVEDVDAVIDAMSFMYEEQSLENGVIKTGGQYFNIISSDFSLSSHGHESGNGLWTFVGPSVSRLGRALGLPLLDYRTISVAPNGSMLQRVMREVERGNIRPLVNITFPLEQAADAMKYLERGRTTGKVVLVVKKA